MAIPLGKMNSFYKEYKKVEQKSLGIRLYDKNFILIIYTLGIVIPS
jgi:hypothetical protein